MVKLSEILTECGRCGLHLERDGDALKGTVLFPDVERPCAELNTAIGSHRTELLAYLDFADEADALLLAATHRLADSWPHNCAALDDNARWWELEDQLRDAYWSLDLTRLEYVVAEREAHALTVFATWAREQTG
jgi:hypothetical protein